MVGESQIHSRTLDYTNTPYSVPDAKRKSWFRDSTRPLHVDFGMIHVLKRKKSRVSNPHRQSALNVAACYRLYSKYNVDPPLYKSYVTIQNRD